MRNMNIIKGLQTQWTETPAANSTFAIGGVSCSADSFVVAESFVLRINISGKNPAHRKSAKRYLQLFGATGCIQGLIATDVKNYLVKHIEKFV
jgi:hypothetical protein